MSGNAAGISWSLERVAIERMKTLGASMAFIRIRSPSSAPPVLRRVGSMAITAIRGSLLYMRKRRTSSSVKRRLAGAAGAGDAEHRDRPAAMRMGVDVVAAVVVEAAGLQRGDDPGQRRGLAGEQAVEVGGQVLRRVEVGAGQHVVDHPLQAEPAAVVGGVDAGDAVGVQLRHLLGDDHPAAAAEDADVAAALLRAAGRACT